ncbi:cardioacceleratory peptide receptor [Biomphalaria glabrata]|nr:cardioacceleratory peptide receptor-like [Biomphalaria glabrata]
MGSLKKECLAQNGSTLYISITQVDSFDLVSLTINTSGLVPRDSSARPDWEFNYEEMFGPNVTCSTQQIELPRDMRFTEDTMISVLAYICMFLVSFVGNAMVFTSLWGSRRSRINLCILHLSVADLFVACVFLPLETVWHATVSWRAGDLACR